MDEINEKNGEQHFKSLTLDVDYYQSFLDDDGIPEDKKQELIETLWQIVVSFVDLGFGIHPLQKMDADAEEQLNPSVLKAITEVANKPTDLSQLKEAWPERSEV